MEARRVFQASRCALASGILALAALSPAQQPPPVATGVTPVAGAAPAAAPSLDDQVREAVEALLASQKGIPAFDAVAPDRAKVRSVETSEDSISVTFNSDLGLKIWNPESASRFEAALRDAISAKTGDAQFALVLKVHKKNEGTEWTYDFADYVTSPEGTRRHNAGASTAAASRPRPAVQTPQYAGPERDGGLAGRHLVVSPSHGWTWHKENRWQLQRARVYTVVEDIYTQSYINPFLIPMLENAGAVVFSTRERDYQTAEVIVDNDAQSSKSRFEKSGMWELAGDGWLGGRPAALGNLDEPFKKGTSMRARVDSASPATATYIPYIPKAGSYAVYASWEHLPDNSDSVPVSVRHAGGTTEVRVNQQMAGSTWVYLGQFVFDPGTNLESGSVTISTEGASTNAAGTTYVGIDAVRFGGGMGNVAPADMISGKPRYAEGARYWTQYAGAPADLVYNIQSSEGHFGENYNQDITARGEWTNYLSGAPNGPNGDRTNPGLGVPIDAMISWHTDAGDDRDGIVGTLSIHSLRGDDGTDKFPDGRSRFLNRDLSSLVALEIARTAREEFSSTWAMRDMWDSGYGEARRPNVPALLLELLSHHNFNDMKYGLDPRFKRDMSRAIYKGIVRFIAHSNGYEPIIQPLPPTDLSVRHLGNGLAEITWKGVEDSLEPTAKPDGFIVYRSPDGRGFDNGTYTVEPRLLVEGLAEGEDYYFRVTAANRGGQSLPSSIAGMMWRQDKKPILVVDGFDRICGPLAIEAENARGFVRSYDKGVGYHNNYGLAGDQLDFDFDSAWFNDLESPGRGASGSDMEDRLEPGNPFNHVAVHGRELKRIGQPFDSMTAAAWSAGSAADNPWMIDWIAGEQRTTMPYPGDFREGAPDRMKPQFQVLDAPARARLREHWMNGGKLLISGSFIGEDLLNGPLADDESRLFAIDVLSLRSTRGFPTKINSVRTLSTGTIGDMNVSRRHFESAFEARHLPSGPWKGAEYLPNLNVFHFGTWLEPEIGVEDPVYGVENSEALDIFAGETFFQYADTEMMAGYRSGNAIVLGFPIESVVPVFARTAILEAAVTQLAK